MTDAGPHHLLCLGLGYSARAVARRVAADGWTVAGSSTTPDGISRIEALGYAAVPFDGSSPSPQLSRQLEHATHLLISAAPGPAGDPVLLNHSADIAAAPHLRWIGYLSTIGVYGNQPDGWVDEATPPRPGNDRTRWRVAAETAWANSAETAGRPVQIFRLAGIYGPGQSAIENIRAGTARRIVKPGQVFNRIHVDDIAAVVCAGMSGRGDRSGRATVYNVADDEPAPPQDVVAHAALLLGVAPPPEIPFASAEMSPMARSFYSDVKRVSNARMKRDLVPALQHPTYREGLAAILLAEAAIP